MLIENFTPGTAERLGIGYVELRALNPRLVYCSITGFGADGPYRDRPGYDLVVSAIGGLMGITGERDGTAGEGGRGDHRRVHGALRAGRHLRGALRP